MPGTAARTAGLRAVAVEFDGDSTLARDPALGEYLADLVRPYGTALRDDLLAAGVGHSYGEMGETLIGDLLSGDDAVDLLVLAHAVPDIRPGRSTALYLSSVCPGRPHAFAICDQGIAAAFTATRLAGEYLRCGDSRNALVLILEQAVLHYVPESDAGTAAPALPDRHAGVAILHSGTLPEVYQDTSIECDEAPRRLLDRLESLPGGAERALVLGAGLSAVSSEAAERLAAEVVRPVGRPLTGVWAAFAEHGERWAAERRCVVLADHDPWSRTLGICVYEPSYKGVGWTR